MGCGASSSRSAAPEVEPKALKAVVPALAGEPADAANSANGGAVKDRDAKPLRLDTSKRLENANDFAALARAASSEAATAEDSTPRKKPLAKLATIDVDQLREEFTRCDVDGNGTLNKEQLTALLTEIVGTDLGAAIDSSGTSVMDSMFAALDEDSSGEIDLDELLAAWRAGFGQAMNPVRCLLIIDVQNDFISGTLRVDKCPAQQDGGAIVPVINAMRAQLPWDAVAVSLDWHPHVHCSFAECFVEQSDDGAAFPLHSSQEAAEAASPAPFSTLTLLSPDGESPMKQILWPRHCVQDTWGAECHPDLARAESDVIVYKGTDARVDSYSAFYDNQKLNQTTLIAELRKRGVTHLFVTGIALDVCVAFSALHAAEEGFVVTVVHDACAGVSEQGIAEKFDAFKKVGITVAQSSELPGLFAKSSLDELTNAALRVRRAKEVSGMMQFESGHGMPID